MAISNGSALAAQREVEDRRSGQVRSPRHYGIGSHLRRGRLFSQRINGLNHFNKQIEAENIEWVIVKVSLTQSGCISHW